MTPRRLLPLVLLAACEPATNALVDEPIQGDLDVPSAIAVLEADRGPFDGAVGYVADRRGGRIRLLDLANGTYLSTRPTASFLRGPGLATGRERLLVGAVPLVSTDRVDVWSADKRFRELIQTPHLQGLDGGGFPVLPEARVVSDAFFDRDGSGDDVAVDVRFVEGRGTTEVWTLTRAIDGWEVRGSRSGLQPGRAMPGPPFRAAHGGPVFLLQGDGTLGDQLVVEVDTGATLVPLDGTPEALSAAPDASHAILSVTDGERAWLRAIDADGTVGDPLALPDGARVTDLSWAADGSVLYAADAAAPQAYLWRPSAPTEVETLPLPWPVEHLVRLDGPDETGRAHLFAHPVGTQEVWRLTLDGEPIDINRVTPEVDGMTLLSPVRGLAPIPHPFDRPGPTTLVDDEPGSRGRAVAISLHSGKVVFMQEEDGCLVRDGAGPRTEILRRTSQQFADYEVTRNEALQNTGPPLTPYLQEVEDPSHHVGVHPCVGIPKAETWTLRYDQLRQGWVATGTLSGEQSRVAVEDQRWSSDDGAIHLLVRAGAIPTEDGWTFTFNLDDGILQADGDNQGDAVREIRFDLPGPPVAFLHDDAGEPVPKVVVAAEAADRIGRIDPRNGLIEVVWD